MGIRYYKPTSPGRRNASVSDFSELTDKNKKPEKSLTEPLEEEGRPEQPGVHHRPAPRRRPQADVPRDRLPAQRPRRSAGRRHAHRIRPQPLGPHRPDRLSRRQEGLHPRSRGSQGRHDRHERPGRRAEGRQLPAAGEDPDRLADPQHRDAARRRRQALSARRASPRRSPPAKGTGPRSRCRRAKSAGFRPPAAPRSAWSATPIT